MTGLALQKEKPRVLCADDDPENLKLLEALLAPKGFEVVTAKTGGEALGRIDGGKIDLVLLDVMMPDMDGLEVCRRIKENERLRHIPVIIITALSSKGDRIKGIEAGADDFLTKPVDHAEVVARVRMLLKMGELNERLTRAYTNINSLISFGERIIKTFNPIEFDFLAKIDSIVGQIIRPYEDGNEKPTVVLVGMFDDRGEWKCFRYESGPEGLRRTPLEVGLLPDLPQRGMSRTIFYTGPEIEKSEMKKFAAALRGLSIRVSNMACYLSNDLSVFALNYGRDFTPHDAAVLKSLVTQGLFLKSLSVRISEVEDAFSYTVQALARAAEALDEDTGNHIVRVGEYSAAIAGALGMKGQFVGRIRLQAQMHDVGKIHIPPHILKKPDKLDESEWDEMRKHGIYGAKIIGGHPRLSLAKSIALTHHERWDGSGYPFGLMGGAIPIEGRILSIADQYDALRNPRAYKPGFSHETAFHVITEGDGRTMPQHFDPEVLHAFKDLAPRFEAIYEALKG